MRLEKSIKGNINAIKDGLNKQKSEDNEHYFDENGNEFKKHEVMSRLTGMAKEKAYYRVSDEYSEYTLFITVLFGIFGAHHFLRGNFKSALIYLLTFGGFGIMYLSDVISICLGSYYYYEASYGYDDENVYRRYKEKMYLREFKGIRVKLMAVILAFIIAALSDIFLCFPIYRVINTGITEFFNTGINAYVNKING